MRTSTIVLSSLLSLTACVGRLEATGPAQLELPDAGPAASDAAIPPLDPPLPLPDAGSAPEADAGPPDTGPVEGALAGDLRIARVDLFQAVRVPIAEGGEPADRDELPVVAGRDAMFRVHAEALPGWRAREIRAVVEIEHGDRRERFEDARVPSLPADDGDRASLFSVRVPASAMAPGASFRVRLEDEGGVRDAPDALYPQDGGFADLQLEPSPPVTVVLVPFRYDTDGSGRLPDVGDEQLARYRAALTSRFPYAEVDLRVHDVVPWSRSTRLSGNVDWGAVNRELISMRDAEDAPSHEYWYGLMAPERSRSAYCDSTYGGCTTGQAFVAGLTGTRVGSGVGFGDTASVGTLAHEIGHMHGRSHIPCGTSGDASYPYSGGVIGVWGWDPTTDTFHDPDEATDLMGYCRPQWVSDYTYRAFWRRAVALRSAITSGRTSDFAVPRRFVTLAGDGTVSWSEVVALRQLPGEAVTGRWLDGRGRAIGALEVGRLIVADTDDRTWVAPDDVPAGARFLEVDGVTLALP